MNPEQPHSPHEELEIKITALLLGELDPAEADDLRRAIETDPELTRLHDQLKQTLDLVKAASTEWSDLSDSSDQPPLRLPDSKRNALLDHFKTQPIPGLAPTRSRAMPWYVPVGIAAVLMIMIGLVSLFPGLTKARWKTQHLAELPASPAVDAPATVEKFEAGVPLQELAPDSPHFISAELISEAIEDRGEVSALARVPVPRPSRAAYKLAMPEQASEMNEWFYSESSSPSDGPSGPISGTGSGWGRPSSALTLQSGERAEVYAFQPDGASKLVPGHGIRGRGVSATTAGSTVDEITAFGFDAENLGSQVALSASDEMGSYQFGTATGGSQQGQEIDRKAGGDPEPMGALESGDAVKGLNNRFGTEYRDHLVPLESEPELNSPHSRLQTEYGGSGGAVSFGEISDSTTKEQAMSARYVADHDKDGIALPALGESQPTTHLWVDGNRRANSQFRNGDAPPPPVQRPPAPKPLKQLAKPVMGDIPILGQLYKSKDPAAEQIANRVQAQQASDRAYYYDASDAKGSTTRDTDSRSLNRSGSQQHGRQDGAKEFAGLAGNKSTPADSNERWGYEEPISEPIEGVRSIDRLSAIPGSAGTDQPLSVNGRIGTVTTFSGVAFDDSHLEPANLSAPVPVKQPPADSGGSLGMLESDEFKRLAPTAKPETVPVSELAISSQSQGSLGADQHTSQRLSSKLTDVRPQIVEGEEASHEGVRKAGSMTDGLAPAQTRHALNQPDIAGVSVLAKVSDDYHVSSMPDSVEVLRRRVDLKGGSEQNVVIALDRISTDKDSEVNASSSTRQLETLYDGKSAAEVALKLDAVNREVLIETETDSIVGGAALSPQSGIRSKNLRNTDAAPPRKPAPEAPTPQPEVQTADNAFSTFSLNVSDVSFKLAAASLERGQMPDVATVRSEEFLNAFDYHDPAPVAGQPLAFAWERARYPFAHNRDLLRFSVQTAAKGREAGRPLNLVILLDNSGSMERADRVGIIHECLNVLSAQLTPQDKVSVVTFARTARLRVDGVPGVQAAASLIAAGQLTPEGGTNLEEAMRLAYATAQRHYLDDGVNRVVLLTDGAANLGNVDPESLKGKVESQRKQGIALDCFGIGWEGYNDDLLEVLSRNGDGRYGFVNTPADAAGEFASQLAGALQVAASDVKMQVEFNPARVTAHRQIGYAKHQLTKEQFRDNTVDAAEIGAAESGNALYVVETNPQGQGPIATVRARFKVPATGQYKEYEWTVPYTGETVALDNASEAMRLAASASAFSEWLASSPYAGEVTTDRLLNTLRGVPEVFGADSRPKKLEGMIREAARLTGN